MSNEVEEEIDATLPLTQEWDTPSNSESPEPDKETWCTLLFSGLPTDKNPNGTRYVPVSENIFTVGRDSDKASRGGHLTSIRISRVHATLTRQLNRNSSTKGRYGNKTLSECEGEKMQVEPKDIIMKITANSTQGLVLNGTFHNDLSFEGWGVSTPKKKRKRIKE